MHRRGNSRRPLRPGIGRLVDRDGQFVYIGPSSFRVRAQREANAVAPADIERLFKAAHARKPLTDSGMAIVAELCRRDGSLWVNTASMWLMEECEENGLSGLDFFVASKEAPQEEWGSDAIQDRARELSVKRHQIGWTFLEPEVVERRQSECAGSLPASGARGSTNTPAPCSSDWGTSRTARGP